ncbi:hypothetical protein ACJX0J_031647 [Zea mays]
MPLHLSPGRGKYKTMTIMQDDCCFSTTRSMDKWFICAYGNAINKKTGQIRMFFGDIITILNFVRAREKRYNIYIFLILVAFSEVNAIETGMKKLMIASTLIYD